MVPNNYMHSLGVMKRFLHHWLKPSSNRFGGVRVLTGTTIALINNHLTHLSDNRYCPTSLAQFRPRTFNHLAHYKATEFRQILLYTGPVIFYFLKKLYAENWDVMVSLNIIFRLSSQFNLDTKPSKRDKIRQSREI